MNNLTTHSWLIDRRHALRALGSFVALPMLNCMRPVGAAESAAEIRRSAFVYIPNGVNTLDYQITSQGTDFTFSRSLQPSGKAQKSSLSDQWPASSWRAGTSPQLPEDLADWRTVGAFGSEYDIC